ncbi:MAG TPA: CheR family methyltransferase [Polyangiaceae bacterium]
MTFTSHPADLERFRDVVARHLGLHFDDARLGTLADVLERRRHRVRESAAGYVARLEAESPRRDELRALAQELTVGETYFFRNIEQLRAFAEVALPRAMGRPDGRPLRVLSAGCASGEEAYSLAMMVRDHAPHISREASITGVDVNAASLAKASAGRYSSWSLRETPPALARRWFRPLERDSVVDPSIRAAVRFEERNLAAEEPGLWQPRTYDVIFCRNVLMYLTPEAARGVVGRIEGALAPGGHLFLGHAETLRGLSQGFHLCHTHGTFYYQRRDGVERASGEMPEEAELGATWIQTIRQSADRIKELSEGSRPEAEVHASTPPDMQGALRLLEHERFGEALRALGDPPQGQPHDPDVLLLRAALLTQSGQLDEAEAACTALCRLDELSAGAHYLLALCREGAGDHRGAEEHDRVAAYLDPAFAMPRLHLGLLARRAGDAGGARRELQQALELLAREDASRVLLFGGGFTREALAHLCRAELVAIGGTP